MADDVQVKLCQQEIIKLDLELKALLQDIRENVDSLDLLQLINNEVQEKVADMKEQIEDLERLGREQDKEIDTVAVLKEAEKHRNQLSSSQMMLRRANLTAQMIIDKKNKEQLLEGTTTIIKSGSSKEEIARTASNVTENLMSISRRMAAQVKQSEGTMSTLIKSSQQIGETHEEFKEMRSQIGHSRKLLTRYGRRECTDKLLIMLAMVFFFATVLYILKKRLFSVSESVPTS